MSSLYPLSLDILLSCPSFWSWGKKLSFFSLRSTFSLVSMISVPSHFLPQSLYKVLPCSVVHLWSVPRHRPLSLYHLKWESVLVPSSVFSLWAFQLHFTQFRFFFILETLHTQVLWLDFLCPLLLLWLLLALLPFSNPWTVGIILRVWCWFSSSSSVFPHWGSLWPQLSTQKIPNQ